jgi:hypothetical protein
MRSRLSLILGLFLTVGAFVALLLLGQVLNPTPYQVTVVIKEVAPGERLRQDMIATDPQSVDPKVATEYILASEADDWMGTTVIDPLHPGQPLLKANLVREGHPKADRRLSLALADGDKVAMVIPVDAETAPQDIRSGDRVDLVYGVGRVREQTGAPSTAPWLANDEDLAGSSVVTGTSWRAPDASLTPTPMPQIDFPFAKVALQDLEVVAVIHDERPNPAYGGPQSDEPPTLKGDVKALQVVLPREHAEMMHYGVTTGDYRIALLSPNAPESGDATLGMTWKDLEAFFWAQREIALGAITGTLPMDGPGAAALVGTSQPTPMAPLTETSAVSSTTPGEEQITDATPDDAADSTGSSLDDSPAESPEGTSDSEETAFSLSGSTDSDSPDPGQAEAPEASDTESPASDEQADEQQETQDAANDQSAAGNLDNLDQVVNASMLRGIVCLGGGLLLAAIVVIAGIRVFRNLTSGDE